MADALLERTSQLSALDERLRVVISRSRGRMVFMAGEAGIGKTALVRAFCDAHPEVRVLCGACDALYTPRPLGPLLVPPAWGSSKDRYSFRCSGAGGG